MAVIKERRVGRAKHKSDTVVLSRRRYERLMEDLHDFALIAERRNESTIGLEEMKRRLRKRGLL